LLGINSAFFIDHGIAQKTGCDELILSTIRQQIARQLLGQKLIVRLVFVERSDDPVAIEPDKSRLVLFKAIRIRIAGRVEPVSGPFFTEVR
jgi:hypothetical protein